MFPLIFLCKHFVVQFLYGSLYSKVIVLTLALIAIFVPILIQIIHIG